MVSRSLWGWLLIRLGLGGVVLWFGLSQLLDPPSWIGYVPEQVANQNLVSVTTLIVLNGSFEVLLGLCILLGFLMRIAAGLFALHLIPIVISLGYNETAIRDAGLFFCALGLCFSGDSKYSIDHCMRNGRWK